MCSGAEVGWEQRDGERERGVWIRPSQDLPYLWCDSCKTQLLVLLKVLDWDVVLLPTILGLQVVTLVGPGYTL